MILLDRLAICVIIVICFFLIFSCKQNDCPKGKAALIQEFNSFVDKTMREKHYYSIKEWESKDMAFSNFIQNCYPAVDSTLYLDEKQKFWSDAIRYYFKRYDNRITAEIFNGKNPNSKIMQTKIRSVWANPDEAFSQIFQEMTGLKFEDELKAVRDSASNSSSN